MCGHTSLPRCYVAAGELPGGCYTTVGGQADCRHSVDDGQGEPISGVGMLDRRSTWHVLGAAVVAPLAGALVLVTGHQPGPAPKAAGRTSSGRARSQARLNGLMPALLTDYLR